MKNPGEQSREIQVQIVAVPSQPNAWREFFRETRLLAALSRRRRAEREAANLKIPVSDQEETSGGDDAS